MPTASCRRVRLSFTKVAEYQARGLVHFHAVLRRDGVTGDPGTVAPPPGYTAQLLAQVVRDTTPTVRSARCPATATAASAGGSQLDVRVIDAASETAYRTAIAAYVAKYGSLLFRVGRLVDLRPYL
ncbi:MAG TPA: replication initiator [Kineosporiaceae bacterium]|nr:replication initiator [Kineosporiaceae bacterium]